MKLRLIAYRNEDSEIPILYYDEYFTKMECSH